MRVKGRKMRVRMNLWSNKIKRMINSRKMNSMNRILLKRYLSK